MNIPGLPVDVHFGEIQDKPAHDWLGKLGHDFDDEVQKPTPEEKALLKVVLGFDPAEADEEKSDVPESKDVS